MKFNIIRLKGILNDSVSVYSVSAQNSMKIKYFQEIDRKIKNMEQNKFIIMIFILFLILILKKILPILLCNFY